MCRRGRDWGLSPTKCTLILDGGIFGFPVTPDVGTHMCLAVNEVMSKLKDAMRIRPTRGNVWVCDDRGVIHVYIRWGSVRAYLGGVVSTIEIASVSIDEAHRGRGLYDRLLHDVCEFADALNKCVYVESVLDVAHHHIYASRGFELLSTGAFDRNYLRPMYNTRVFAHD